MWSAAAHFFSAIGNVRLLQLSVDRRSPGLVNQPGVRHNQAISKLNTLGYYIIADGRYIPL